MKCQNCGAELQDGVLFCRECGSKIKKRFCRECGAEIKEDSRFCSNCGANLKFNFDNQCFEETPENGQKEEFEGYKGYKENSGCKEDSHQQENIEEQVVYRETKERQQNDSDFWKCLFTQNSQRIIALIIIAFFFLLLVMHMIGKSNAKDDTTVPNYESANSVATEDFETEENQIDIDDANYVDNIEPSESHVEDESENKPQKDGFDDDTNVEVSVGLASFEIPSYWEADINEKNHYRAYAETSGKVAVLEIMASYDYSDPVTYELLKKENDNGSMGESVKSRFDSCGEIKSESFSNGKISGFIYSCDFEYEGYSGRAYEAVFPSAEDNRWLFVTLTETDNTEYSYYSDFMKSMETISL